MGVEKNLGKWWTKMWIMWISKKSNIDFVQFVELTIKVNFL